MSEEKTTNKKGLVIALIVLLLLSVGGNVFQILSNKAEIEKKDQEFTTLSTDHEEVKQLLKDSEELAQKLEGDLAESNEEVKAKLEQIEKIKLLNDSLIQSGLDKDELNRRLRANLALVRKLNKQLETKVDELLVENKKLESQNNELTENLDSVNTINDDLTKKVEKASALAASNIKAYALKERLFGDDLKKTSLARRAIKIEVEFDILKNEITEPGEKLVLLKIVSPEGKTLGTFNKNGGDSEMQSNGAVTYADAKKFTYAGEVQTLKLSFVKEEDKELPEGNYMIEIIVDGDVAASETLELK